MPAHGRWRSPTGERIPTCTIITTEANEDIEPIHDRKPVILPDDDWPAWLGESAATPDELRDMLKPLPLGRLDIWPSISAS
jgi:putative SOS response-associated peptidase YedK